MATDNLLIEIKDLHTYFYLAEGVVRAVDGVDLRIKRGQTMGIVGESGCGKSVTALSLMQLVPPPGRIESGEILFYRAVRGNNASTMTEVVKITDLKPNSKEMRSIRGNQISMVFQEPMTAMSPVRTIGAQIMEVIMLHQEVDRAEARRRAIDMLARVNLPNPAQAIDRYPFELSGGMRQRALIAMALSCHPSLLIADEPTTALDVTTEAQILELMRTLQNDLGMAIMYITHNMGVIAEMADEVAVMYLGRVVEQTDVQSLFFNPLHPYTRALLKSIPQLSDATAKKRRRLEVIKGMVPDPYSILKGCTFHPRCEEMIPGVCDQVLPMLIEVEPNHSVRCHLYGTP
ncbi:MAG: ABC transporter ATP-binding protein [Anaerolineae bacterium]|nr:ABC transporter ATP-binding protein [Anaerolineae bacterium]